MTTGRYEDLDGLRKYEVELTNGSTVNVWARNAKDARRGVELAPGEKVKSCALAEA